MKLQRRARKFTRRGGPAVAHLVLVRPMGTPRFLITLFLVSFSVAPLAVAAVTRDGLSFERAILVEGNYKHSVDWEWDYLKRKMGLRGMPKEQELTQHNGRTYDKFVFSGRVVYFDITRFEKEIFKMRTKSLEQLMKEKGIIK
jgi:hypothetical protein